MGGGELIFCTVQSGLSCEREVSACLKVMSGGINSNLDRRITSSSLIIMSDKISNNWLLTE